MKEKVIEKFCSMMKEQNPQQTFVVESCKNATTCQRLWFIRVFFEKVPDIYIPPTYNIFSCRPAVFGCIMDFEYELKEEI